MLLPRLVFQYFICFATRTGLGTIALNSGLAVIALYRRVTAGWLDLHSSPNTEANEHARSDAVNNPPQRDALTDQVGVFGKMSLQNLDGVECELLVALE